MNEGWSEDKYLIVFTDEESRSATHRYATHVYLPGFSVVGLCGWDDLLVCDASARLFTVPAVPCEARYLAVFPEASLSLPLQQDQRLAGKIKWYVKPLVFGGDPDADDNMIWVSHEQHAELVRWWNDVYRSGRRQD